MRNIHTIATLRVLSGSAILTLWAAQKYCKSCGICVSLYIECSPLSEYLVFHIHNILIDTVMNLYSILVQNSLNVMRGSDRHF